MRFARVHKVAAYLLASLGLVVLATGGELAGAPSVVLAIGVVLSWWAEGERIHDPRYIRAWNVAVVGTLAVEAARVVLSGLAPISAAVEFASVLQLSRLANRRTARDYQQITTLAMLHLIAATVLGAGLSYALCFLGFVIVTPWAMTLGHLRREIEGNYLADARAGRQHVPIDVARILRSRRVVGPGLLVGSSLLALPIFLITSVLFVLFPRLGFGMFSVRGAQGTAVTGLGDHVDLSGHGTIRDDPTVVLRVEPPNLPADPPPYRTFRLRGAAFDTYDGHAWRRSPGRGGALEREASWYRLRTWDDDLSRGYRVVLDPIDPPVVLLPPRTNAVRVEPRVEAGRPRWPELTVDAAGEVRYPNTDDLGLVYTAVVAPDTSGDGYAGDGSPMSGEELARYTALPPGMSPRLLELARTLTAPHASAIEKARAIERHLQSFRYTLTLESGGAAEPLDDFLFRSHAGHCEYFSSAMAVMLRAVHIPTRNVTGFLGGSFNRYGRFYAVRQGDAHSWVEVYEPTRGWVTFDPTPPAREAPVVRNRSLAELEAIVEAMRVRWRRYVVGFDLSTQTRLALHFGNWLRLKGFTRRGETTERGVPRASRAQAPSRWPAARIAKVAGAALVAGALGAFLWSRRRGSAGGRRPGERPAVREARALAVALDAAFVARGKTRPPSATPLAHANALARSNDPFAPLAQRVAHRYVAARFGDEPLASGELVALRKELTEAPIAP